MIINKDKLPIKYVFGIYNKHKDYPTLKDNLYELYSTLDDINKTSFFNTETTKVFNKKYKDLSRDELLVQFLLNGYIQKIDAESTSKKIKYEVIRTPWQ